jgi:hypothetical protein
MDSTVDVLRKARALIEDESRWGQHALEFEGRYCVQGAVNVVITGDAFQSCGLKAKDALREQVPDGRPLYLFNNTHSHADVLALFDRAIAEQERLQAEARADASEKEKEEIPSRSPRVRASCVGARERVSAR